MPMTPCAFIALVTATLLSQAPAPAKERATYIITTPDGKFPVFWEERQTQEGADGVRVEVDEPWNPRFWQGKKSQVSEEVPERKSSREQRIRKGYEEHGYVEVNGRFLSKAEVALAERARSMAGLPPPSSVAAPPPEPSVDLTTAPPETVHDAPPPNFFKRWAPHAGLVFLAALFLVLVGRTLLT